MQIEQSLENIAVAEIDKLEENQHFKEFVKKMDSNKLDTLVQQINNTISPKIDCTTCGNCCQSLMINVTEAECTAVSRHLKQSTVDFKNNYVETSMQGQMVMNTIPCAFLTEKKCTIYKNRFAECRAFPHLDQENFKSRIYGTLMHYGRCLIIYNVVETLKVQSGFKNPTPLHIL